MRKGYVLLTIDEGSHVKVWNGEIHSTADCCLNSFPRDTEVNAWGPFEINVPEGFQNAETVKGRAIDLGLLSIFCKK